MLRRLHLGKREEVVIVKQNKKGFELILTKVEMDRLGYIAQHYFTTRTQGQEANVIRLLINEGYRKIVGGILLNDYNNTRRNRL